MTPREAAFLTLRATYDEGKYSNIALDSAISKYNLEGREKAQFTRLYYGCIERKITLEHAISEYASKSAGELDDAVRIALSVCFYQLLYNDSSADYAAVNEAVELVKKYSHSSYAGYVNAVARAFIRGGKKYNLPDDEIEALSVKYSVDEDIISEIKKDYPEKYGEVLDSFNLIPHVTLRVNELKTDYGSLKDFLTENGASVADGNSGVSLRVIKDGGAVEKAIAGGLCYVQDESSQAAVSVLGVKPGMTAVDCCAAPGGKSFFAAIEMKNEGRVYSFDLRKSKLSLIKKGADALGIDIIETREHDGREPNGNLVGRADRVICDVPCSGLGVIAKKPEIRYKKKSDFARLGATQEKILRAGSEYLKSGGRLLYSTCTIRKEENEKIVGAFLGEQSGFELIEEKTILPGQDKDGFYYAVIEKK